MCAPNVDLNAGVHVDTYEWQRIITFLLFYYPTWCEHCVFKPKVKKKKMATLTKVLVGDKIQKSLSKLFIYLGANRHVSSWYASLKLLWHWLFHNLSVGTRSNSVETYSKPSPLTLTEGSLYLNEDTNEVSLAMGGALRCIPNAVTFTNLFASTINDSSKMIKIRNNNLKKNEGTLDVGLSFPDGMWSYFERENR